MNFLFKIHAKFLQDAYTSAKLDKNPYSCAPSIVFLSCMFSLLYFQFHQYTSSYTRWKARLYKDVFFHWAYFYITRLWFLFTKFARYLITSMDQFIEDNSPKEEIVLNQTLTHVCMFIVMLTISFIPLVILSLQQMYRTNIPNFLIWVTEDPRTNSEIGTSGHYLERPPRFVQSYKSSAASYRSKRSTSFDSDIFLDKANDSCRHSKSMSTFNVGTSLEDLTKAK
ncbi:unnamed protein product [Psylliodes chrysocephalus]|uniref:Uncharacterized protein n=1 Tax=Psylliodes chrysocephalus TaxID=3402493 RepID=A0A9P0CPR1_9CUCU|nr:unnamed protein product [Psylliodes chrysocephala]